MKKFDQDRVYRPTDQEMRVLATPGTLAVWRHQGRGPAYAKCGKRILYRGEDLNRFIDDHLIGTADQRPVPA